jgi:2-oxoglutarate ferredoxin oxidoreductase subunit gamma
MMQQNILISGTGGQGIISSGEFLSEALFKKGYEIMFSRSYGASARGGACMSQIMISDQIINELQFEKSDILLCLSLPAFKKYMPMAKPGSLILVDTSVYSRVNYFRDDLEIFQIPAREIAASLGNQIVANMVMLGALAQRSEIVDLEYLKDAVNSYMRESMREINLEALQKGHDSK